MKNRFDRLVIDLEPKSIIFTSEPYVVYTKTGFSVAADIIINLMGSKVEKSLLLGAKSLADPLLERMLQNAGRLSGIEVWIYKSGTERTAKYIVED